MKSARFFAGVKVSPDDPENAYLRVSCYQTNERLEAPEGSVEVPGNHVRFSVWWRDEARCVMSISESEARELASFLTTELGKLGPATMSMES
jgi:hypothetical protein